MILSIVRIPIALTKIAIAPMGKERGNSQQVTHLGVLTVLKESLSPVGDAYGVLIGSSKNMAFTLPLFLICLRYTRLLSHSPVLRYCTREKQ